MFTKKSVLLGLALVVFFSSLGLVISTAAPRTPPTTAAPTTTSQPTVAPTTTAQPTTTSQPTAAPTTTIAPTLLPVVSTQSPVQTTAPPGDAGGFFSIMNSEALISGNELVMSRSSTIISKAIFNVSVRQIDVSFIANFGFKEDSTSMSFGIATSAALTPYVRCKITKNSIVVGKTNEFRALSSVGQDTNLHTINIKTKIEDGAAVCLISVDDRAFPSVKLYEAEWQLLIHSDLSAEPSGDATRKVVVVNGV